MANVIDILVSKQAQAELDKVIASLKVTHEEIIKINQQGLKINSGASPKNPQQMNSSVKESIALNERLEKQNEKLRLSEIKLQIAREKAIDKYNAQLEKQSQKQINESNKIIAQKEKEFAKFEKQFNKYEADLAKQVIAEQNAIKKQVQSILDQSKSMQSLQNQREKELLQLAKEEQKLQASQNIYNKTQQQLNRVQSAYNNLAAKKERYNNLSAYEEVRLKTLQVLTEKYNTTLKAVDATVGKHTRNVGNYADAFNPVSNSITQLTREMPAFANSVQTGFMAISNNLPIFFDAMQQTIAQQKELQKQGLPSKNALQILAGGLFTLGTALSVGVTLLTVYGAEVVNFITGAKKKKEAIEAEKKALEEKQKVEEQARETTASFQSGELSRSKILFENAKNLTLTYKERKNAINELRERYPDYLKNLTDEQILAGNTADAENELNNALIKRGVALAAQEMLQKNLTDELKLRLKNAELLKQSLEDQQKIIQQGNEIVVYTDKQKAAEQQKEALARKSRKDQYNNYVQSIIALRDERQAIIATYNENAKYLGAVKENTSATKKNTKAKEENEILTIGTEKWLNKQITDLRELNATLSDSTEEYQVGAKSIEFYEQWLERLRGAAKKAKDELDGVSLDLGGSEFITDIDGDELMRQGNELRAWYKEFREGFQDDFWANSGFDKINFIIENFDKLKESGTDMALALSEAFQQAFNTISEFSDANYQQMYSNLERQRDVNILFAGESATAREEIDRQYEERRKRIQRQQAESQKRLAMFNIATNTAQAIMAVFAKTPPPAGIPLAIAVGAIGAAQLALTASQPIPQFYKGTQNAPEGLAWTDEKGAELHTDSKGNIKDYGSNKGARLKKLEKGDKIYTASQTKKMMDLYGFNQDFNNIMLTNGISTSNFNNNSLNLEPLNARIDRLTNVVANKSEFTMVNNESGTRYYERVNGQRRELVNSVLTMKSRTIK